VAKRLREQDSKNEVLFSTYLDAVAYIRHNHFPVVEVPPLDFKAKPDGSVDFRRTAMDPGPFVAPISFLRQVCKEIETMEAFEPDIVVSDSRASPLVAARLLNIPTICVLNQFQVIIPRKTHYLRLAKLADAITLAIIGKIWTTGAKVIIPDFPQPYTISMGNLRIPRSFAEKIELVGPILPVRSEALPTRRELRRKLGLREEGVVVFAPISGPLKERSYLLQILQRILSKFPEKFQIVMSLGDPMACESEAHHGTFSIFKWIQNRFEYLKACDAIVSRAGHGTLLQAICYGKPSILIPTPNHTEQFNNAKKAVKLGVALTIEQDRLCRETLLHGMSRVINENSFLERTQEMMSDVSSYDGLETVTKTIVEVAGG
jgi:UDP:flavonoid glycosyltransferase YjiC (YdhE family)